jgi:hypothetical protein
MEVLALIIPFWILIGLACFTCDRDWSMGSTRVFFLAHRWSTHHSGGPGVDCAG